MQCLASLDHHSRSRQYFNLLIDIPFVVGFDFVLYEY